MNKTALITGTTGQYGAYLTKVLLGKGYKVVGLVRSYSHRNITRIEYLGVKDNVSIVECDLTDLTQVLSAIKEHQPAEIYNLAAQSSVSLSFKQPIGTIQFNKAGNMISLFRMY
jgi:GDPmannose 4,6-dehydratase